MTIAGGKSLTHEVKRFRLWADTLRGHHGEWEFDYPDWDTFYRAVFDFLKTKHDQWSKDDVSNILFALARDNEGENILDQIRENPPLLLFLAGHVLGSEQSEAKWQIAAALGDIPETFRAETEKLLVTLADDKDEYVSRRSILALGKIKSEYAEALAERAWKSEHEYQRIAALWVLKDVSSTKLVNYLALAIKDGRQHLKKNAEEISQALLDDAKD